MSSRSTQRARCKARLRLLDCALRMSGTRESDLLKLSEAALMNIRDALQPTGEFADDEEEEVT
jgi:hypothetical protein